MHANCNLINVWLVACLSENLITGHCSTCDKFDYEYHLTYVLFNRYIVSTTDSPSSSFGYHIKSTFISRLMFTFACHESIRRSCRNGSKCGIKKRLHFMQISSLLANGYIKRKKSTIHIPITCNQFRLTSITSRMPEPTPADSSISQLVACLTTQWVPAHICESMRLCKGQLLNKH